MAYSAALTASRSAMHCVGRRHVICTGERRRCFGFLTKGIAKEVNYLWRLTTKPKDWSFTALGLPQTNKTGRDVKKNLLLSARPASCILSQNTLHKRLMIYLEITLVPMELKDEKRMRRGLVECQGNTLFPDRSIGGCIQVDWKCWKRLLLVSKLLDDQGRQDSR